jgi:hypothetical protein
MKLYYNKITGVLGATATATTNVQKLTVKRYQDVEVELVPVTEAGVVELFATGSTGLLVVKTVADFTGSAKILDTAWDAPVVEGRGYTFNFVAAGAAIDTALDTLPSLAFALEIVVVASGKRIPMPTLQLVIENNYYREDEPVPADPDPPYPLPAQLVIEDVPHGAVKITAAGLAIKDTATNTWRLVTFVSGEITYTTL